MPLVILLTAQLKWCLDIKSALDSKKIICLKDLVHLIIAMQAFESNYITIMNTLNAALHCIEIHVMHI